jgi:hypothetical protein
MADEMGSRGAELNRVTKPARAERMKAGYGRESVGRPDETGIRRGEEMMDRQPDVDTDQGPPSRQTSTAKEISGQV